MNRILSRLTLGLAALGVVLIGFESQADARGRRCVRQHGCRTACHKFCEPKRCEPKRCEPQSCEPKCEQPVCESDCGGCQKKCGCKKRCGRHKSRKQCGGCDSGGCGGGYNGGEVREASQDGPAPAPPEEDAPSA